MERHVILWHEVRSINLGPPILCELLICAIKAASVGGPVRCLLLIVVVNIFEWIKRTNYGFVRKEIHFTIPLFAYHSNTR